MSVCRTVDSENWRNLSKISFLAMSTAKILSPFPIGYQNTEVPYFFFPNTVPCPLVPCGGVVRLPDVTSLQLTTPLITNSQSAGSRVPGDPAQFRALSTPSVSIEVLRQVIGVKAAKIFPKIRLIDFTISGQPKSIKTGSCSLSFIHITLHTRTHSLLDAAYKLHARLSSAPARG